MRTRANIAGQQFGSLTTVEPLGHSKHGWKWRCKCSCGNEREVLATRLLQGATKSCVPCVKIAASETPWRKGRKNYQFSGQQLELFIDEIRQRREAGEMITRKRISAIAQGIYERAA